MKNNFLPFQIGEHYEKWEFDLEDNTRQDLNRKLKLSNKISSSQDHLKCSYSEYKSGSLRYCVISQLPNKTIIIYGSSHIIHPVSLNVLDEIQH